MTTKVRPPQPCPEEYKAKLEQLDAMSRSTLAKYNVPWLVQTIFVDQDYLTLLDIADRWKDKEATRDNAAKDLELDKHDYTKQEQDRAAQRLSQAVEEMQKYHRENIMDTKEKRDKTAMSPGARENLVANYKQLTGRAPDLQLQGSDNYMKLQFEQCYQGKVGVFTNKQIISQIPSFETRTKRRRTDMDGVTHDYEEEYCNDPADLDSWRKQMRIFYTTLLMCTAGCPQHSNLQIDMDDINAYYEDFLFGDRVLGRSPPPSIKVLMIAERKAWRDIHIKVCKGTTLKEAMRQITIDSLFWTNELARKGKGDSKDGKGNSYQSNNWKGSTSYKGKGQKGNKGKYNNKGYNNQSWGKGYNSQRNDLSARMGNGKSKGKKGKNKKGFSTRDNANNQDYCMNYHFRNNCPGQCGRSHNCPNCGQAHSKSTCPTATTGN